MMARKTRTTRIGLLREPGMLERESLRDRISSGLAERGIVPICAGPGMGKTDAIADALKTWTDASGSTRYVSLRGVGSYDALRLVGAEIRKARRECATDLLMAFDDVPAMDEGSAAEMAHELESALHGGIAVLVAMRPDSELLVQALDIPCIRARELVIHPDEVASRGTGAWKGRVDLPYELTHDIPALVNALCGQTGTDSADLGTTAEYLDALSRVARGASEEELMDEERRQRVAMLLLGSGSFSDLEIATGELDPDVAIALQRDEPLFGVDVTTRSFQVAGFCCEATALGCEALLGHLARGMDEEVRTCAELLAERGDFARSGLVAECASERKVKLDFVLQWPVELLDAGCIALVEEAALEAGEDGEQPFGQAVAESALACLDQDGSPFDSFLPDLPEPVGVRESVMARQVQLMGIARSIAAGMRPDEQVCMAEETDPISRKIAAHIEAISHLLDGEFRSAFRLLLVGCEPRDASSLTSALLVEDFHVARVLVGDRLSSDDLEVLEEAYDFLTEVGLKTWAGYHHSLMTMLPLMVGEASEAADLGNSLARAERHGDASLACLFELGSSLMDLHRHLSARAHVRATRAADLARRCGSVSLLSAALVSDGIAQGQAGDCRALDSLASEGMAWAESLESEIADAPEAQPEGPVDAAFMSSPLGLFACRLAGLVSAALVFDESGLIAYASRLSNDDLPNDGLPLLRLSISLLGEAATPLHEFLPVGWTTRLLAFERALADDGDEVASSARGTNGSFEPGKSRRTDDELRIQMLGSFVVTRGGVLIPEQSWRRQASRVLLMLLAIAKGHAAERVSIMEAIWPEVDYLSGRGRVYTALSTLRQTLGTTDEGSSYILGHGSEIRLDPEHVSCDVDELRDAAGAICEQEHDDVWRLKTCRSIARIYRGPLYVPVTDATGVFTRCRSVLRQDFVSAMVVGTEAALHLGNAHEAVRFSELACRELPMREDAVTALVRALTSAGRASEARDAYRRYSASVIEETGLPPSAELRRAAARLDAEPSGTIPPARAMAAETPDEDMPRPARPSTSGVVFAEFTDVPADEEEAPEREGEAQGDGPDGTDESEESDEAVQAS